MGALTIVLTFVNVCGVDHMFLYDAHSCNVGSTIKTGVIV